MRFQVCTAIFYGAFVLGGLLLAWSVGLWVYDWHRRRRDPGSLICRECAYDLTGHAYPAHGKVFLVDAERGSCPECGADLHSESAIVLRSSVSAPASRRRRLAALAIFLGSLTCYFVSDALSKDVMAEASRLVGINERGSRWWDWTLCGSTMVLAALVWLRRTRVRKA